MANLQLPLPHSFYERDTLLVAQDLVGCYLHRRLPETLGEGVLIRGIHPISGEEQMRDLRGGRKALADGPGKLCQAMAITGADYGSYLSGNTLFITPRTDPVALRATPRIGIDYAETRHEPWRFIDAREKRR